MSAMPQPPWCADELPRPGRDFARLAADLDRFGYCLVERAVEGGKLHAVRTRLLEQAAAERELHAMKNPANRDAKNQWIGMLLNKGEPFRDLLRHELARLMLAHVLGEDFTLSCLDSQIQHPGAGDMPLHTDQWWMPPPQRPGQPHTRPAAIRREHIAGSLDPSPASEPIAPPACCNVMLMITDFRAENGATRVVPGSHLSGRQPDRAVPHPMPTVPAEGPAGTAIVFDGRLWHGAGANRTNESRYGITMDCCGPQFRALENYTRGLRPEALAACEPALRERLGFCTWSSYGHTGDPDARFTGDGSTTLGECGAGD